jgi:tetratricopeptide (TPR) repeat protein
MARSAPRVFLSHSSKDKDFVKELYRRLTRDGVSCFLDSESISPGENWVTALERGLDESDAIVLVLTPDFCDSKWADKERTSSSADHRKLVPLLLRPCMDLPRFPRFLRDIHTIDVSTNQKFEERYPRICRELGGTPGEDVIFEDRRTLPPIRPLPTKHRMPYRSLDDKFVGRVDSFWILHDALFRDGTAILSGVAVAVGTGGLGKTQLAIEYAHRFGAAYSGVYWVDADRGLSTLIAQVSEAANIDIDTKAAESIQLEQVWHGLNAMPVISLLILDNFPEQGSLQPYLPVGGRVHTLITTRRQDLSHPSVRLNVLTTEEGVRLLNTGERQFGNDTGALLVDRLGGLPLALELARGYLNHRKRLTIPELLKELSDLELLTEFAERYLDYLPSGHEKDIVRTFQLSWDAAPPLAQQVLRLMGELAPVSVPRFLLRDALKLTGDSPVRDPLDKALAELSRLSLIDLDADGDPIAHRLILAFARHRDVPDFASPFDQCVAAALKQMQRVSSLPDARTMSELNLLTPHVEFLVSATRLPPEAFSELENQLGMHYHALGRYSDARVALTAALTSAEKTFETGHRFIAVHWGNLAAVLKQLGQLEEARDLLRKALESDEKSFEAGHPSIANDQSNLALVLQDLGELEEARDLLQKAIESSETSFKTGHTSTAIFQSNLALVLQALGQPEQAHDLLRKVLESVEKTFEPGHPAIARSQSNLAVVLLELGRSEEARDLGRTAVESDEKSFEAGHPSIATSRANLAMVLKDMGQLEQARDLLRKAHAAFLSSLGPDHSYTLTIQGHLEGLDD